MKYSKEEKALRREIVRILFPEALHPELHISDERVSDMVFLVKRDFYSNSQLTISGKDLTDEDL
jgi:hypothetical protein